MTVPVWTVLTLAYHLASRLAYVLYVGLALRRQERTGYFTRRYGPEEGFRRFRRASPRRCSTRPPSSRSTARSKSRISTGLSPAPGEAAGRVVAGACGNRTHRGPCEPQTVLKTAQTTRPNPPPRRR